MWNGLSSPRFSRIAWSSAGVADGPPISVAASPGTSCMMENEIRLTSARIGTACIKRRRM